MTKRLHEGKLGKEAIAGLVRWIDDSNFLLFHSYMTRFTGCSCVLYLGANGLYVATHAQFFDLLSCISHFPDSGYHNIFFDPTCMYPNLPYFTDTIEEILVRSMNPFYPYFNDDNLISDDNNDSALLVSENDNVALFFTSIYDHEMHAQQVNQLEALRALFNV